MMLLRREDTGEELLFEGDPLFRGGEGHIFSVPGEASLVAKVYHQPKPGLTLKLQAMLAAPPQDPSAGQDWVSIAWPRTRLFDSAGVCTGYLMARIDQARVISDVFNPKRRLEVYPHFHYGYLLRTARNLAVAVRALHEHGYVLGDLSGTNFLVTPRALVSLVDTDSFQVKADGITFRCRVGTREYTPPELQEARFVEVDRSREQDAFGLAVLIFQLLMQGIHPFAGRYTGEGEPGSVGRRIHEGHWPYARTRPVPYEPNPHAPPWDAVPAPVQNLFQLCFDAGCFDPGVRPGAAAWQRALTQAEGTLRQCKHNSQHRYSEALGQDCPWCRQARKWKLDLFPEKKETQEAPFKKPGPQPPPSPVLQSPVPPPLPSAPELEAIAAPEPVGQPAVPPPLPPPEFIKPESENRWVYLGLVGLAMVLVLLLAGLKLLSQ